MGLVILTFLQFSLVLSFFVLTLPLLRSQTSKNISKDKIYQSKNMITFYFSFFIKHIILYIK